MVNSRKIGLALGSGSARGLAHIGVIRALEEIDIKIDVIAGTSIGALVGSAQAAGRLDSLQKAYEGFDWRDVAGYLDVVFPKSGLIEGRKVADFVRGHVPFETIEELPLPFGTVATDMLTGEEVVFTGGDIIDAVRASISVPGIFTPFRLNGQVLIDGGVVNPVPVNLARQLGADLVIAVDLNHYVLPANNHAAHADITAKEEAAKGRLQQLAEQYYAQARRHLNESLDRSDNPVAIQLREWLSSEPLPSIFDVLLASINIFETHVTRIRLRIDPPDILIRPQLGEVHFLDFTRARDIIDAGYRATQEQLESIQEAVDTIANT